ncbi:MAG: hypothetical protein IT393_03780 [Nitrospirae bacterium]|nr:hypothetical protein [Nitrospirota bacterium]
MDRGKDIETPYRHRGSTRDKRIADGCRYLAKPFTPTDVKKLISDFFASDYREGGIA